MSFIQSIQDAYAGLHTFLYAQIVEPILFYTGKMAWAEDLFEGTEWFMLGLIQIAIIALVFRTWERFDPAETQTNTKSFVRTDILYTLIHRLGIFMGCSSSCSPDYFSIYPAYYTIGDLNDLMSRAGYQE